VAAAAYPTLAPVAPRASTALGNSQGWTAVGGTPVTLQQGETLGTISGRYGVPVSALLAVNGLSSVNAAKPGQQIMIPAYNAVQGSAASAPRVASASAMLPSRETVTDAPKAIAPRATVRDVAPRAESEAEKRAAAKLKQLRQRDDDEDDTPATPSRAVPKTASIDKAAIEKSQAEKARLEAQRKVQAEQKAAELRKADELKKAEAAARREAAAKAAAAKKQAQDETTASIPEQKVAARPIERAAPAPVEAPKPQAEQADASSFRWPAQGKVINGFGGRSASGPNDGINISVPEGTPVRAAEGGTVIHADDALKGYGKLVLVRHANGLVTVYAHNSDIKVKRGENVRRGQVIAASGSSGNVTSPQLHFQIRKGAQALDPMKHLASN
jgi:murein DD-endopeptidase MepM/ murein hydrolase activator NlpD